MTATGEDRAPGTSRLWTRDAQGRQTAPPATPPTPNAQHRVRPRAVGAPGYRQTLPCTEESARLARELVVAALHAWGFEDRAGDAALIASELSVNAIRHSGGRSLGVGVVQTVRSDGQYVRISVKDSSRVTPVLQTPGDVDEHGRGLLIVEELSQRWGTDTLPTGKRVWADLRVGEGGGIAGTEPPCTAGVRRARRPRCSATARIGPYAPYALQLLSPTDRDGDLHGQRFRCELEQHRHAEGPGTHYAYVGEATPSLPDATKPHELWLVWHPDFVYFTALTGCLAADPHDDGTHCLLPAGHRLAHDWDVAADEDSAWDAAR